MNGWKNKSRLSKNLRANQQLQGKKNLKVKYKLVKQGLLIRLLNILYLHY